MSELKPCACGASGEDVWLGDTNHNYSRLCGMPNLYFIKCDNCEVCIGFEKTEQGCIKMWNQHYEFSNSQDQE